jgi:NAD(P)H-dependent FMN reductase
VHAPDIVRADAVPLCTLEHASGPPGIFNDLLDWTFGSDGLHTKAVALITVAADSRGEAARMSMEAALGDVGVQVLVEACTQVPVTGRSVGEYGLLADPRVRQGQRPPSGDRTSGEGPR